MKYEMTYFDYLSITRQEDTRESFEKYLMDVLDYTEEQAEKESEVYYNESTKS